MASSFASFPAPTGAAAVPATGHPVVWLRPVAIGSASLTAGSSPGTSARAILAEVKNCASHLVETGEGHSIDLRFLKAMPDERALLAAWLGRGEVSAVVDSIGRTEIQETGIPCVWWIRHLNSAGETVGELIEITDVPDLIVGDREAVAPVLESLRTDPPAGLSTASTITAPPQER